VIIPKDGFLAENERIKEYISRRDAEAQRKEKEKIYILKNSSKIL